jgi:hypothetical protein
MWVVIALANDIPFRMLVIMGGGGSGEYINKQKKEASSAVIPHNEWDFSVTLV